jgi:uncharacterized Zn-binding protein involved in type VI secretion
MQTPAVVPIPHVGGPIISPGMPTVLIGNLPAARITDMCVCVGPPDVIMRGSAGVLIGSLNAARIGDNTAHGGVIIQGWPTVIIGEIGVVTPAPPRMPALPNVALPDVPAMPAMPAPPKLPEITALEAGLLSSIAGATLDLMARPGSAAVPAGAQSSSASPPSGTPTPSSVPAAPPAAVQALSKAVPAVGQTMQKMADKPGSAFAERGAAALGALNDALAAVPADQLPPVVRAAIEDLQARIEAARAAYGEASAKVAEMIAAAEQKATELKQRYDELQAEKERIRNHAAKGLDDWNNLVGRYEATRDELKRHADEAKHLGKEVSSKTREFANTKPPTLPIRRR